MASNQAGSIGGMNRQNGAVRAGEFWEEERVSLQLSPRHRRSQTQRKQNVTASPKKVPSQVTNTDKDYGLI